LLNGIYICLHMKTVKITTSQNIDIDYEVAGISERVSARLIDYAIFYAIFMICIVIFAGVGVGGAKAFDSSGFLITLAVWLGFCVFYDLICELFFNGQSIGKRNIKIKVISLNGARPSTGQYLLRWAFRIIDFGITFGSGALLTVALSNNKQRVGDMVAGTTLVKTQPINKLGDLVFNSPGSDYEPVYAEVANLTDQDVVLIHDVIRNFKRTRNNLLVYRLAIKIKDFLKITSEAGVNEYQFLEIILNDYNQLTGQHTL
jgi:uncharacterized RDD family membrane protein YckC